MSQAEPWGREVPRISLLNKLVGACITGNALTANDDDFSVKSFASILLKVFALATSFSPIPSIKP